MLGSLSPVAPPASRISIRAVPLETLSSSIERLAAFPLAAIPAGVPSPSIEGAATILLPAISIGMPATPTPVGRASRIPTGTVAVEALSFPVEAAWVTTRTISFEASVPAIGRAATFPLRTAFDAFSAPVEPRARPILTCGLSPRIAFSASVEPRAGAILTRGLPPRIAFSAPVEPSAGSFPIRLMSPRILRRPAASLAGPIERAPAGVVEGWLPA